MKLVPLFSISLVLLAAVFVSPLAVAQDDAQSSMEQAKREYRRGNYQAAVDTLNQVVVAAPDRADAYYLLGYAQLMLRRYPDSVDAFARAFQIDPKLDPRSIYRRRPAEQRCP